MPGESDFGYPVVSRTTRNRPEVQPSTSSQHQLRSRGAAASYSGELPDSRAARRATRVAKLLAASTFALPSPTGQPPSGNPQGTVQPLPAVPVSGHAVNHQPLLGRHVLLPQVSTQALHALQKPAHTVVLCEQSPTPVTATLSSLLPAEPVCGHSVNPQPLLGIPVLPPRVSTQALHTLQQPAPTVVLCERSRTPVTATYSSVISPQPQLDTVPPHAGPVPRGSGDSLEPELLGIAATPPHVGPSPRGKSDLLAPYVVGSAVPPHAGPVPRGSGDSPEPELLGIAATPPHVGPSPRGKRDLLASEFAGSAAPPHVGFTPRGKSDLPAPEVAGSVVPPHAGPVPRGIGNSPEPKHLGTAAATAAAHPAESSPRALTPRSLSPVPAELPAEYPSPGSPSAPLVGRLRPNTAEQLRSVSNTPGRVPVAAHTPAVRRGLPTQTSGNPLFHTAASQQQWFRDSNPTSVTVGVSVYRGISSSAGSFSSAHTPPGPPSSDPSGSSAPPSAISSAASAVAVRVTPGCATCPPLVAVSDSEDDSWDYMADDKADKWRAVGVITPAVAILLKTKVHSILADLVAKMHARPQHILMVLQQHTQTLLIPGSEPYKLFVRGMDCALDKYCPNVTLLFDRHNELPTDQVFGHRDQLAKAKRPHRATSQALGAHAASAAGRPSAPRVTPAASLSSVSTAVPPAGNLRPGPATLMTRAEADAHNATVEVALLAMLPDKVDAVAAMAVLHPDVAHDHAAYNPLRMHVEAQLTEECRENLAVAMQYRAQHWRVGPYADELPTPPPEHSDSDSDSSTASRSTMRSTRSMASTARSHGRRGHDSDDEWPHGQGESLTRLSRTPVRLIANAEVPIFAWLEYVYARLLISTIASSSAEMGQVFRSRKFREHQQHRLESLDAYLEEMSVGMIMVQDTIAESECYQIVLDNLGDPLTRPTRALCAHVPHKRWTMDLIREQALLCFEHASREAVQARHKALVITHRKLADEPKPRQDTRADPKPRSDTRPRYPNRGRSAALAQVAESEHVVAAGVAAPNNSGVGKNARVDPKGPRQPYQGGGGAPRPQGGRGGPRPDPGEQICHHCQEKGHIKFRCPRWLNEQLAEVTAQRGAGGARPPRVVAAAMATSAAIQGFIAADMGYDDELHGYDCSALHVADMSSELWDEEDAVLFTSGPGGGYSACTVACMPGQFRSACPASSHSSDEDGHVADVSPPPAAAPAVSSIAPEPAAVSADPGPSHVAEITRVLAQVAGIPPGAEVLTPAEARLRERGARRAATAAARPAAPHRRAMGPAPAPQPGPEVKPPAPPAAGHVPAPEVEILALLNEYRQHCQILARRAHSAAVLYMGMRIMVHATPDSMPPQFAWMSHRIDQLEAGLPGTVAEQWAALEDFPQRTPAQLRAMQESVPPGANGSLPQVIMLTRYCCNQCYVLGLRCDAASALYLELCLALRAAPPAPRVTLLHVRSVMDRIRPLIEGLSGTHDEQLEALRGYPCLSRADMQALAAQVLPPAAAMYAELTELAALGGPRVAPDDDPAEERHVVVLHPADSDSEEFELEELEQPERRSFSRNVHNAEMRAVARRMDSINRSWFTSGARTAGPEEPRLWPGQAAVDWVTQRANAQSVAQRLGTMLSNGEFVPAAQPPWTHPRGPTTERECWLAELDRHSRVDAAVSSMLSTIPATLALLEDLLEAKYPGQHYTDVPHAQYGDPGCPLVRQFVSLHRGYKALESAQTQPWDLDIHWERLALAYRRQAWHTEAEGRTVYPGPEAGPTAAPYIPIADDFPPLPAPAAEARPAPHTVAGGQAPLPDDDEEVLCWVGGQMGLHLPVAPLRVARGVVRHLGAGSRDDDAVLDPEQHDYTDLDRLLWPEVEDAEEPQPGASREEEAQSKGPPGAAPRLPVPVGPTAQLTPTQMHRAVTAIERMDRFCDMRRGITSRTNIPAWAQPLVMDYVQIQLHTHALRTREVNSLRYMRTPGWRRQVLDHQQSTSAAIVEAERAFEAVLREPPPERLASLPEYGDARRDASEEWQAYWSAVAATTLEALGVAWDVTLFARMDTSDLDEQSSDREAAAQSDQPEGRPQGDPPRGEPREATPHYSPTRIRERRQQLAEPIVRSSPVSGFGRRRSQHRRPRSKVLAGPWVGNAPAARQALAEPIRPHVGTVAAMQAKAPAQKRRAEAQRDPSPRRSPSPKRARNSDTDSSYSKEDESSPEPASPAAPLPPGPASGMERLVQAVCGKHRALIGCVLELVDESEEVAPKYKRWVRKLLDPLLAVLANPAGPAVQSQQLQDIYRAVAPSSSTPLFRIAAAALDAPPARPVAQPARRAPPMQHARHAPPVQPAGRATPEPPARRAHPARSRDAPLPAPPPLGMIPRSQLGNLDAAHTEPVSPVVATLLAQVNAMNERLAAFERGRGGRGGRSGRGGRGGRQQRHDQQPYQGQRHRQYQPVVYPDEGEEWDQYGPRHLNVVSLLFNLPLDMHAPAEQLEDPLGSPVCAVNAVAQRVPHTAGQHVPHSFRQRPAVESPPVAGGEGSEESQARTPPKPLAPSPALADRQPTMQPAPAPAARRPTVQSAGLGSSWAAAMEAVDLLKGSKPTTQQQRGAALAAIASKAGESKLMFEIMRAEFMRDLPPMDLTRLRSANLEWRKAHCSDAAISSTLVKHVGKTLGDTVSILVNGEQVIPPDIMRDDGCDTTMLDSLFAKRADIKYKTCESRIIMANGAPCKVLGSTVMRLTICHGTEYEVHSMHLVFIMEGLHRLCDFLVGTPQELRHNIFVDHWSQALYYLPYAYPVPGGRQWIDIQRFKAVPICSVRERSRQASSVISLLSDATKEVRPPRPVLACCHVELVEEHEEEDQVPPAVVPAPAPEPLLVNATQPCIPRTEQEIAALIAESDARIRQALGDDMVVATTWDEHGNQVSTQVVFDYRVVGQHAHSQALDDIKVDWTDASVDGKVWHLPGSERVRCMLPHPEYPCMLVPATPVPLELCCGDCQFCEDSIWLDEKSMTRASCSHPRTVPNPEMVGTAERPGPHYQMEEQRARGEYGHTPWSDSDEWPEVTPVPGKPTVSAAMMAATPAACAAGPCAENRPRRRQRGRRGKRSKRQVNPAPPTSWLGRMAGKASASLCKLVSKPIAAASTWADDLRYQSQGERAKVTRPERNRTIAREVGGRCKTTTQKHHLPRATVAPRFRFGWAAVPALLLFWLVSSMFLLSTAVLAVTTPALTVAAVSPDLVAVGPQAAAWAALLDITEWLPDQPHSDPHLHWMHEPELYPGGIAHSFAVAAGMMDTMPEGQSCVLHATGYQKDEAGGWVWGHHGDATPEQFAALQKTVRDRKESAFAYSMNDLPGYSGAQGPFEIKLDNGGKPVYSGPRRYSPKEQEIASEKCGELRDAKLIERCEPAMHAAPMVIVPKKDGDGNWTSARVCFDYRMINKVTVADRYGLHNPEDLVQGMLGKKFFSKLDLRSGFSQIPIDLSERNKTAFWWGNQLWQHTRMPFGMRNAPAKFQRIMDFELATNGAEECAKAFIDDVIIYSSTMEQHVNDVALVLDILSKCGLRAHPDKSLFGASCLEYLGHNVSAAGMSPNEAKVAAIQALRPPTNVSELRSVVGFMNYYRVYVPNFSQHAKPLTLLFGEKVAWQWERPQQEAFEKLKELLTRPGIVLRRFDPKARTVLHTDWSKNGIGAVLGQYGPDGQEYMVACISRSLNVHEANYSSYQGEMLACVWAMKTFRHYLHGTAFKVVTDHQPLQWLMETEGLTGKHARWALTIQDMEFTIEHRPGVKHQNADVPSRFPRPDDTDLTGARLDGPATSPLGAARTPAARRKDSATRPEEQPALAHAAGVLRESPCNALDRQHSRCISEVWHALAVSTLPISSAAHDMPHPDDLMAGNSGRLCDAREHVDFVDSPLAVSRLAKLRQRFHRWVAGASWTSASIPHARVLSLAQSGPYTATQHSETVSLNTTPLTPAQIESAWEDGVVVLELFGGICAGLEAALRNGLKVNRYLYVDHGEVPQRAAQYRVQQLHARYPATFPLEASVAAFRALPQDVYLLQPQTLAQAGAMKGEQWMVVAGWECQDLSPAGSGKGLAGKRSSTFFPMLNVVGTLQRIQTQRPPIYWLENAASQHNHKHPQVRRDHQVICQCIGDPVCVDAARLGSGAHRLRNFWTNMCDSAMLDHVLQTVQRPEGVTAQQRLDPGCSVKTCLSVHPSPPYYPANTKGQPRVVMPALLARMDTYSRRSGTGLIVDAKDPLHPYQRMANATERERMLGYDAGTTAAPGLTEEDRHALTGRCMDMQVMESLFGLSLALQCPAVACVNVCQVQQQQLLEHYGHGARIILDQGYTPAKGLLDRPVTAAQGQGQKHRRGLGYGEPRVVSAVVQQPTGAESGGEDTHADPTSSPITDFMLEHEPEYAFLLGLHCLAACADFEQRQNEPVMAAVADITDPNLADVWNDTLVLRFLRKGTMPEGTSTPEQYRITRRAASYTLKGEQLSRIMADGSTRIVPQPALRKQIALTMHEQCGHYGRKRTASLVMAQYWWHGLHQSVKDVVRKCALCDRVRGSFQPSQPTLQPLPIKGMFYRWGVDLCGPFNETPRGNTYVLVAIEYFSKHVELVPIPSKHSTHTAYAMMHNVFGRFGASAEVVTDGGGEFQGDFHDMLEACYVDHRTTSANHPQANGLAERTVKTIKSALRKHLADNPESTVWDLELPWVALGYRCSVQESTGLSPYELLYGTRPVIPPAVHERMESPVNWDDSEAAVQSVLDRAAAMKANVAIARGNLDIAQHRDTQRYAMVRSGAYRPKVHDLQVGDYVYLRRANPANTLQIRTLPAILRVIAVRPSGVLLLQGRCTRVIAVHATRCTQCHLPDIEPDMDPSLFQPGRDHACQVCNMTSDEPNMIMCNACNAGWHRKCLSPPLKQVPSGVWVCPNCTESGVTTAEVQALESARRAAEGLTSQKAEAKFLSRKDQLTAAQGRELHGRLIRKPFKDPVTNRIRMYVGKLQYQGLRAKGVHQYLVRYTDGDAETILLHDITAEMLLPSDSEEPEELLVAIAAMDMISEGARQRVQNILNWHMPGAWTKKHVTRLAGCLPGGPGCLTAEGTHECVPTLKEEVEVLVKLVHADRLGVCFDAWSGTGTIAAALREQIGLRVVTNDINTSTNAMYHEDALQPRLYDYMRANHGVQSIVCSPWFRMLDMAAPLALAGCTKVACLHVPGHYFYDAHPIRQAWLKKLQVEGRLAVITGLPNGPLGRRCIWLLLFATAKMRSVILRSHTTDSAMLFV